LQLIHGVDLDGEEDQGAERHDGRDVGGQAGEGRGAEAGVRSARLAQLVRLALVGADSDLEPIL
jgi:hypothetical protein